MLEYAFKGRVVFFEGAECLVEPVADLLVAVVADVFPAGLGRHEERLLVVVGIVGAPFGVLSGAALFELSGEDLLALDVEHVAGALQEQRTEDVLLELGGIHLAAEDVGSCEEMSFELGQGEHGERAGGTRLAQSYQRPLCSQPSRTRQF